MRRRVVGAALAIAAFSLAVQPFRSRDRVEAQTASDVTASDTEFPSVNWSATVVQSSGSVGHFETQDPTGGNPGPYRDMTHIANINAGNWSISVSHVYQNLSYDPSTDGSIVAVDFSADHYVQTAAPAPVTNGYALVQGGKVFVANSTALTSASWTNLAATCLKESDFTDQQDGTHPSFAASGSIQFGYLRASSGPANNTALTIDHGIDNWMVTIHRAPAGPCGGPPAPTPSPTPKPQPDLFVTIAPPHVFQSKLVYELTYGNRGSGVSTGVTIQLALDEVDSIDSQHSIPPPISVGTLAPGTSATQSVSLEPLLPNSARQDDITLTATISDDGSSGADANPADNTAIETQQCDLGQPQFCPVSYMYCQAATTPTPTPGPSAALPSSSLVTGLERAAGRAWQALRNVAIDLGTFYRVRNEVLEPTAGGRRYIELYYTHGPEIVALLASDSSLRDTAMAAIASWQPQLQVLLSGQGDTLVFTQDMADTMSALLAELQAEGSASLSAAIQQELAVVSLQSWVGLTMNQAVTGFRSAVADPAGTLTVQGGRFQVQASWTTTDGTTGSGRAVQLTPDSGYFWFFDPTNAEMVVKVLNGCGVDNSYWVFAGGLTNVEVVVTVADTQTGEIKSYLNPQGTAFAPILDTQAFATCSGAAFLTPNPEAPSAATPRVGRQRQQAPGGACVADATTLCLDGSRFRVEAAWTTADGQAGAAQAVSLSPNSGYFWFFDPGNVEMLVKVLDGCAVDGKQWVFAGGLTNVQVVLTVTDTQTGAVQTYTNPQATAFLPVQDTSAFAVCP